MEFGLSESTINRLKTFFKQFAEIEEVKIYGSRAKGNFRKGSDVDFALYGDIDFNLLALIVKEIDELPTPYKFDITVYNSLMHKPLKEHIDRVGKVFYQRVG